VLHSFPTRRSSDLSGSWASSTRTIQAPMFEKLLLTVQGNVIGGANAKKAAALAEGNTELADGYKRLLIALGSSGLAAGFRVFGKDQMAAEPQGEMHALAVKLTDLIMIDRFDVTKNFNDNLIEIERTLGGKFGVISQQQQKDTDKAKREHQDSQVNVGTMLTAPKPSGFTPTPMTNDKWVNPNMITALSIFFRQYYDNIMTLPV